MMFQSAADGRSLLGFLFVTVAAALFLVITCMGAYDLAVNSQREVREYNAHMRECVPKQAEKRCQELWRWAR